MMRAKPQRQYPSPTPVRGPIRQQESASLKCFSSASVSITEAGNPDSSLWLLFFHCEAQNTEQRIEHNKKQGKGEREILLL